MPCGWRIGCAPVSPVRSSRAGSRVVAYTATFVFLATEPGEFRNYYCSLPGHRETGMEGVLIGEPAEGPSHEHQETTEVEGTPGAKAHSVWMKLRGAKRRPGVVS